MIKSPSFSFSFFTGLFPAGACAVLLALLAGSARADWPDNNPNPTKWVEWPDASPTGFDILAGVGPPGTANPLPIILADDFKCMKTGPITDIHLWVSWFGLNGTTVVPPVPITLGIWSDVPATNGPGGTITPSHPGQLLWTNTFAPGTYKVRPWKPAEEQFWDPDPFPAGLIMGHDNLIWQYNFYPDAVNTFTQTGSVTAPVIYWLSMTAGTLQTGTPGQFIGWKTSTNQLMDNAVFGHLNAAGVPLGDWNELMDPTRPDRSLDFSFALTTSEIVTNPPSATNKWVQYPAVLNGFDIKATAPLIVGDDFQCTNSGPITNIQVWASSPDNQPNPNMRITIAVWTDMPWTSATGANNGYSRPGRLLCRNVFQPGEYTISDAGQGEELFYDPVSGTLTPETRIFLYNFNLKSPCCQQGSAANPRTYWVTLTAQPVGTAASPIGWKTSTNHWHDYAVFGLPDAAGNISWNPVFNPIQTPAKAGLDLAFIVNCGPPDPICEPALVPKWIQPPDRSTNGMDVLATATNVMGEDFLCRVTGPISGVTIWGSWLGDKVDTNAVFQVSLWTDIPADPATGLGYSRPGSQLCSTTFFPPQTGGTWIDRYQYKLFASNLAERFYNPDLGNAGVIGNDTQIWRYDFYPDQFGNSCWRQQGSSFANGATYWIVVSYLPAAGTVNPPLFGWKTSTIHRMDDAVYGHLNPNNFPLGDWKDLRDLQTGLSKDLSLALYNFPVTSANKDLVNTTATAVNGVQVVIPGFHIITAHYDGVPYWPNFTVSYNGGDTVLQWSGQSIPSGGKTHVGWEFPGASQAYSSVNWTLNGAVIAPPIPQVNLVYVRTNLVLINNISQSAVGMLDGSQVEFYSTAPTLDQMVGNGQRRPISTVPLPPAADKMIAGGAMMVSVPTPPAAARFALFLINLSDPVATPTVTDYILVPLDVALQPFIDGVAVSDNQISLSFSSVAGRAYRVQYKTDLSASAWTDSGLGDIEAESGETEAMLPISAAQSFFRVMLVP